MYVCICRAVTESEVHDCIAAGAATARQVRDATGAGGDCARCVRKICAILKRSEQLASTA
ncbi:(2Fe-2S)-binding protein [Thermostaphylospora chromogena]|uniref:Bacterioferritin-associated ferredoxin n=1 Tax=Thermostaphylospora chromogena TaxID=35622 RepID=A0A1H1EG80_9ACTN|nr:(2Fe-2S)-binding protein [Thermostaphylospora chromogena]SDQ87801.1 bacterioferritin-associated ferredoxin [Thermostaphylospora chromogena]